MKNIRLRFYILFPGLGFLAVLVMGIVIFMRFQSLAEGWDDYTKNVYTEYIDLLNKNTLGKMTLYIEREMPILHDPERLKQEAGTEWFWEVSSQFTRIAQTFGFAYIYYIEKVESGGYVFLMSSGIGKDMHPEWLGGPVWQGETPTFIDEAWESKQLTYSPSITSNEWGQMISAELPILNDGKIVGILGVDYDVSSLNKTLYVQDEALTSWRVALQRLLRIDFIIFTMVILVIMCVQIVLDYKSVLVPIQTMEANERTRLMMDATPLACSIWDADGNMLDCNMEALNMLGLSKKSDYIERFYDLNPEYQSDGMSSKEKAAILIKAAFETGYQRFEWMYLTASGELLPVETTLVRVPWKNSYRLTAYSRDMREIKIKEEAARETEERLRIMLDEMAFSCIFFDEDGNILDCNQRTVIVFGSKDKQDIIDNFFHFSPEFQSDGRSSREKALEFIQDTFKTGKNVFPWEHLRGDGSSLPTEITLLRVKWKNSYRVIAYAQDLSDLMETTDNLSRLTAITEGSPSLALYIGDQGAIEYMNPSVSVISDFSKDKLVKEAPRHVSSDGEPRSKQEEGNAGDGKKQSGQFEINLLTQAGENRDFMFYVFPTRLRTGTPGIGLVGRDITDMKQVQQDLIVAKEQAERAMDREAHYNKAKSDFLSRVSHEMRTPLNAIIGMTNIARKSSSAKDQEPCFDNIEEASERLLGIVNDILDMTGIDSGELVFSHETFSFSKAIGSVIDTIELKAKVKRLQFITTIDEGIPDKLVSDERRLKQVLTNLLSNAVKFTPESGTIGLSAALRENRGTACLIRFEVSDSGVGISPEAQQRIWEAFEQADTSITREYGGIGLSLALTKRIARLMNGDIQVESDLFKGSRFICDILCDIDLSGQELGEEGIPDLAGRRFLVVDDLDINRAVILAILEDTGATIDEAGDGAKAVELFSQNKYDMVLMDLHMPGMDGLDATRGIRASAFPWAGETPVIALTADDSAEMRARCREAGLNEYLTKPISADILFKTITRFSN